MSTHDLYVPPEIVLMVLASPNLTITDILTCTRVNREWYGLIYDTNNLRAKLFLPKQREALPPETDIVCCRDYSGIFGQFARHRSWHCDRY
jgi:hypothetical protein